MKGWEKFTAENPKGSLYIPRSTGSKAYQVVKKASEEAIKNGKDIIVIDDSQYLMSNEFFDRAYEKGYGKFTDMGKNFHDMIVWARNQPDNVLIYFLHHLELDSDGSKKVKTVGKMLDTQTSIEGKFTICLLAEKEDESYELKSSVPSESIFKAPPEMLEDEMDNNLAEVDQKIRSFWGI